MLRGLLEPVRFLWNATRGTRLRPWRSAYLRWRVETYTGWPAESIGLKRVVELAWRERRQIGRYLRWLGEMRRIVVLGRAR